MSPSNGSCCLIAVRSAGSLFHYIRSRHFSGIMGQWIRFSLASVSERLVPVRITVVVGPYDIWRVFVVFAVRAMSLTSSGNSIRSASENIHSRSILT